MPRDGARDATGTETGETAGIKAQRIPVADPTGNDASIMNPTFPAGRAITDRETWTARPAGLLLADLTKARLSSLVLATTAVGFVLASVGAPDWASLTWVLVGTALAAFGANALNQCLEADLDARMMRTRNRPIPAGRIRRAHAATIGTALALAGPVLLWRLVNPLAALLAAMTVVIYVVLYTPLKRVTSLNTLVGAVCGALPPMLGWAAVTGGLDRGAWTLGLLLFLWQIPHFLALALMYREDYARGGFRMLPFADPTGQMTFNVTVLYALALLPLGLLAALSGMAGWVSALGVALIGTGFVATCFRLRREGTRGAARFVFVASLCYLPLVLTLLVVDRGPAPGLVRHTAPVTLARQADRPRP